MAVTIGVLKPILSELDILAIFYDGLAGNEDVEPCLKRIMDSQLMTVQVECASLALIDKDCRLGDSTAYLTVRQILQKQNLRFLE